MSNYKIIGIIDIKVSITVTEIVFLPQFEFMLFFREFTWLTLIHFRNIFVFCYSSRCVYIKEKYSYV